MGYSYTIQANGGNSSASNQMNVFVYPDDANDEYACENEVIPALIDACEQAYNSSTHIDYWEVSYTTDHPGVWDPEEDRETALDKFTSDLEDQSSIPVGSHLLVDNNHTGGLADGGDITCDRYRDDRAAWFDWAPAVYGADGDSGAYMGNIAIHEVLHNFINFCIQDIQDMAPREHSLGQLYPNPLHDSASPMISSYENEYNQEGDCQSNVWFVTRHTHALTSCTKTALEETVKEHSTI